MKVIVEMWDIDKPNLNGRVYPRKVVEKAIVDFKEKIAKDQGLGEFTDYQCRDNDPGVKMEFVSHKVNDLKFDENDNVVADITILETPCGKNLKLLSEDELHKKFKFVPRGIGGFEEGNIIKEGYKLVSVDCIEKETNE